MRYPVLALAIAFSPIFTLAAGVELVLQLPADVQVKSAKAVSSAMKVETVATLSGPTLHFTNLLPDTPYDVQLTLVDGTTVQGIDLTWYNEEPAKADAGPLKDEDRNAMRALVQDIKDFYNKKRIVHLRGDHTRSVALVELIRDDPFHADNGEIVWRMELWYFKNQFGGWEKISQQNKVLRRERLKGSAVYRAATDKLKWVPELGGLRVPKDKGTLTVQLPAMNEKK